MDAQTPNIGQRERGCSIEPGDSRKKEMRNLCQSNVCEEKYPYKLYLLHMGGGCAYVRIRGNGGADGEGVKMRGVEPM